MKMRSQKAIVTILVVLILSTVSTAAYALTVTANGQLIGSSTDTVDVNGVLTTTVDFSGGVTVDGFSISGTAIAEQSGSEERMLFQSMSIAGPAGCSADTPCLISITATSTDFQPKEPGGYPAAVLINATVVGAAGNEISATGETNVDIVNADVGGTEVSVPWNCTGTPSCAFTTFGDPSVDVFGDVGFENIQLAACGTALCTPEQSFTINMKFVGSTINVPAAGTVESRNGSAEPLKETVPPLSGTSLKLSLTKVQINRLEGFPDLSKADFSLNARFRVNGNGIDPPNETVRVGVGTYLATIPEGSFRPIPMGRFAFNGTIDGVALKAQIAPLGGGNWEVKVDGKGANLTSTRKPVPVGVQIGDDSGAAWANKAKILDP